jgi:hypothetical protein
VIKFLQDVDALLPKPPPAPPGPPGAPPQLGPAVSQAPAPIQ